MKLAQVRDFLAVVECGSISATARKLGVSQPGLTKSLGALEAELGAALLKRTPKGVTLTRQGQAFHVRARAGYAELRMAQEELSRSARMQVALGFGPFFAAQIVPQAVERFRARYPEVELRLMEGLGHSTRPMVRDATLDMALAPRPPLAREDPAIRFKPIAHLAQIVVARRGHALARSRSAAGLAGAEWLCSLRREVAMQALASIGVPGPLRVIECESFSATLTLLTGSDMLAVVPHPFLELPQARERVQEIAIAERLPGLTVGLHTRADSPLSPPAAAMARLLAEAGRRLLRRA